MGESNTDQGERGSGLDPQRSVDRWRWRRRIALSSLAAGLVYPVLAGAAAIVEPRVSETLSSLAWPLYTFCGANVGAYIGTAAWEHVRKPERY